MFVPCFQTYVSSESFLTFQHIALEIEMPRNSNDNLRAEEAPWRSTLEKFLKNGDCCHLDPYKQKNNEGVIQLLFEEKTGENEKREILNILKWIKYVSVNYRTTSDLLSPIIHQHNGLAVVFKTMLNNTTCCSTLEKDLFVFKTMFS